MRQPVMHNGQMELLMSEKTNLTRNNLTELVTAHISHRQYSCAILDGWNNGIMFLTRPHRIDGNKCQFMAIEWCCITTAVVLYMADAKYIRWFES